MLKLALRVLDVRRRRLVKHSACAKEEKIFCKRQVEHQKQDNKEDGDTPHFVREHFVGFVGRAELVLFVLLLLRDDGRIVFGYILVSRVCNDSLEVSAENVVVESLFELFNHLRRLRMLSHFDFVKLNEFHCMEQRIFHSAAF